MTEKNKRDGLSTAKTLFEIFKVIAEVVLIYFIIKYGHMFNASFKNKELNLKYTQLAVEILQTEPNANSVGLREWAVSILGSNTDFPLTAQAKSELLKHRLPAAWDDNTKWNDNAVWKDEVN